MDIFKSMHFFFYLLLSASSNIFGLTDLVLFSLSDCPYHY